MSFILAAIRTGTDPVGKLPEGSFHRWLEEQLLCPKCDATYNLVCDYNASVGRHFEEQARRPVQMLRKAIFLDHAAGHRISHFETAGVVVTSHTPPRAEPATPERKPFPPLGPKPTIH